MEYSLRDSDLNDQPWLESLRRTVYKDLFDKTWGGWDEERHQRHVRACWDREHIQIAEISDTPVGMLQVVETEGQTEICEIQILPTYQGQGLGSRILRNVIEVAQRTSKPLVLSTGLKNDGALKLYKRLGFNETSRCEMKVYMMHKPS